MVHDSSPAESPSAPPIPLDDGRRESRHRLVASSDSHTADIESGEPLDGGVYDDLLQKAHGDRNLVATWLAQLGAPPSLSRRAQPFETGSRSMTERPTDEQMEDALLARGAPNHLRCPISLKLFRDPVIVSTGQSYERRALERWLADNDMTCFVTGQPLRHPVVMMPNHALRKATEEWVEQHAPWLLGPDGHLKPIGGEADFADAHPPDPAYAHVVAEPDVVYHHSRDQPSADRDLAMAIRLQDEEMARAASQRRTAPWPPAGPHEEQVASASSVEPRRRADILSNASPPLWAMSVGLVAMLVLAFWKAGWTFETVHNNPLLGPTAVGLQAMGAVSHGLIVDRHQYWRLVTSIFLPAGIINLFLAVTTLWTLGKYLERLLPAAMLTVPLLYIVSGVIGAAVSANLNVAAISTGATAAVMGLLGAVWADQLLLWRQYANHIATLVVLAATTAVFIALGFLPLVDNFFQIVALGTGLLLGAVVVAWRRKRSARLYSQAGGKSRGCGWTLVQLACLTAIVALAGVAGVGLALKSSVGADCHWCKHFVCIGTDWWACSAGSLVQQQPSCGFTDVGSGTTLTCPSGANSTVPGPAAALNATTRVQLCNSDCFSSSPLPLVPTGGPSSPELSPSPSPTPETGGPEVTNGTVTVSAPPSNKGGNASDGLLI